MKLLIGLCAALLAAWVSQPAAAQPLDIPGLPRTAFYSLAASGDTLLAGADSVIYVSTDGGINWGPTNAIVAGSTAIDAVIATGAGLFAASFGKGVFRSQDGGKGWSSLNAGLSGIGALNVTDFERWGSKLYAATEGAGVFELDLEAPTRWRPFGGEFAANEASTVAGLARTGNTLLAGAGGNGLVFVRNLEETFWTPVQLFGHIITVAATDLGLLAATRRQVFFSRDGGETWAPTGVLGPSAVSSVLATAAGPEDGREAFIALTVGELLSWLYRSADPEQPWVWMGEAAEILDLLVYGDRLYLAQWDGLRYWPLTPGTDVEVGLPGAAGASIETPHPHPIFRSARFGYSVDAPGQVRFDLHDALGRTVAVLVDEERPAGRHEITWHTSDLPPGLYVGRLRHPGGTTSRTFVVLD